jgi:hypothetical protein
MDDQFHTNLPSGRFTLQPMLHKTGLSRTG